MKNLVNCFFWGFRILWVLTVPTVKVAYYSLRLAVSAFKLGLSVTRNVTNGLDYIGSLPGRLRRKAIKKSPAPNGVGE